MTTNNTGGAVLCGADTHAGTPCKRPVKFGYTKCHKHGGASPDAKVKAERFMALIRMPAIEALYDIIERFLSNRCDTCGLPNADAATTRATIRACEVVLDRAGMPARSQVEVVQGGDGFNVGQLTAEEQSEMTMIVSQYNALTQRIKNRLALLESPDTPQAPSTTTVQ